MPVFVKFYSLNTKKVRSSQTIFLFWCQVILGCWVLAVGCHQPIPPDPKPITFTLLQLNDVYEIAPLEGGKSGGLARVAHLKQELLRENPNTIALLAGDFLSPSLIGNLKLPDGERIQGLQMVETLNALPLDYATFGNHEFDISNPAILEKRLGQSAFTYVCSNAMYKDSTGIRPFRQGNKSVPPYVIHTFKGNDGSTVRVGIIGVVLPFNKQPYIHYEDVTETFRKTYKAIESQCDLIIGITHLNEVEDEALARDVPGALLFMGGHDHVHMSHYVERTIITKADANAKTVYVHRVTYYPQTGQSRVTSTLTPITDAMPEHPTTKSVVDKWLKQVDNIANGMGFNPNEVLTTTETPLECKEPVIRSRQTNFGGIVTSAMAAAFPEANLWVLNSGSMRLDDDLMGQVTVYDILRTLPFGGSVVEVKLPGTIVADMLQTGLVTNRGEGGYLQTKGVSKNTSGQWMVQNQPLQPDRTYQVVMPQFLAEGKEQNLGFVAKYPFVLSPERKGIRNDIRDLVIDYLRKGGK